MKKKYGCFLSLLLTVSIAALLSGCSGGSGKTAGGELMQKNNSEHANRLINETSPYLLQHARNPVDWYPWGDEAFTKARSENKLIFLSIGYSTCHWCHVMEKESFEDDEVAALLNESYVAIKVDREQRPDLDSVFMDAAMLINNRGGWPLNLVLTPDGKPFFAATYIPKSGNGYMKGLLELLPEIESIWSSEPGRITGAAEQVVHSLADMNNRNNSGRADALTSSVNSPLNEIKQSAYESLLQSYDAENGGFGQKPKFPQAQNILFLLRYYNSSGESKAAEMAVTTLLRMRSGGIYDQLGFGFHRYSTDERWLLPHFEKMLYDQAMMLLAYTEAWQLTGREEYRQTADEIIQYVLRDMRSSAGAFFSAEDADSEGEEGKFYTWDYKEFTELLQTNGFDAGRFAELYMISPEGNFSDEASGIGSGKNILHISDGDIAEASGPARDVLFSKRENRIRPQMDDKVLTDWNGLMIFALAKASWVFDRRDYYDAAARAAGFILSTMKSADGSLLHSYREEMTGITGMLDDYAFMIRGLLELYRSGFDTGYIEEALTLAAYARENLEDKDNGGYFQADRKQTDLLIRKKNTFDNALPSGNSVMYENLMQLFKITGETEWRDSSDGIMRTVSSGLNSYPSAFGMLLSSFEYSAETAVEIIISGTTEEAAKMLKTVNGRFLPGAVVIIKTPENSEKLGMIAPYTESYINSEGSQAAFVCRNFTCSRPVHTAEELEKLL